MALPPWGRGGHLLLTACINIKSKVYARIFFIENNYLLARKTSRNGSVRRFMGFPPTRRRKLGVHNVDSCDHQCAARTRRYRSIASVAQEESNRLPQRSLDRERSVTRGSGLVSDCILQEVAIRGDRKIFETSRCTIHNAPQICETYRLHRAVPAEATPSLAATTARQQR